MTEISINLGVAVPIEEYDELHRILNQIRVNYKVHSGKKCTKGKALVWAIKNGYTEVIKILEGKQKSISERLEKLKQDKRIVEESE